MVGKSLLQQIPVYHLAHQGANSMHTQALTQGEASVGEPLLDCTEFPTESIVTSLFLDVSAMRRGLFIGFSSSRGESEELA